MEKLKMHTQDVADANIEKIGHLFPNCLTERIIGKDKDGKDIVDKAIDFDKLKQELSKEIVEGTQERYQFTWPGKREAMRLANTPTNMTLRPDRESSVDFDNTENLYIEGDNLEVLKLLRENYLGKVKMIYIDPPYNTGTDAFVYSDDFSIDIAEFIGISRQKDADGNLLYSIKENNESNGRYHTNWLNMMYPRLRVAKDLLRMDGVIFISIDDHELRNLKYLCDEIFGEKNFVGQIVVAKGTTTGQDANDIGSSVDYMLMYAKQKELFIPKGLPLSEEDKARFNMEDENGRFSILQYRKTGSGDRREDRPKLYFPITAPDGTQVYPYGPGGYESRWRADKKQYDLWEKNGMVYWKKDADGQYKPYIKYYLEGRTKQVSNLWDDVEGNKKASITVKELLGKDIFSFPKPVGLIQRCIEISTDDNDLILDFFSGSATTAHAVMKQNFVDGGTRKFILVQIPESTPEKSDARKAGYNNLCQIGEERIRRAGKKILEEQQSKKNEADLFSSAEPEHKLDTGFRVLKLDTSNMQDVYYKPEDFSENTLFEDNVKPVRTSEDLLFQVMLECNLPLSAKIEKKTIAGKEVFNINDGYLIACFDENVNETVITEVAKQKPYYFIMRDKSLSSDNVADNFEQIFNAYSKDTIRKIL